MQATNDSELPTVAVAKAANRDLSHSVVLTAEFKPFQEIDVMAKVAGYVKNIYVDSGDRVKQGQLLAVLEVPEMASDIARAKASLKRSQAEVARARDELQRAKAAHEMNHLAFQRLEAVSKTRPGLVAQQEIDDAHSRDLQGEAQIAAATSALNAAQEQVNVAEAEQTKINTMFEYTRVIAPFTGVVTKRFANTGSMIQAGTSSTTQTMPLVRLSENGSLRLILPVPESEVPLIKIGKSVSVRVPTLQRVFTGKIARFADTLQLSTRTMDTEVDVPNPQLIIIPGMYAEVTLPLTASLNALAIPLPALGGSEDRRTVFVVNSTGHIEEKPVEVGMETADSAEIKSGLAAGDLVVVGSRSQLKPGQQVKPRLVEMTGVKGGA
ncbi:MAG TPA: efflux RND transporter periplasmic adaptor subunit [Bryobacteraceae bacterium]|nr:efflux RND transporter periplasmic adaptor subunit [Bryobacteraceae bacterium]